MSLVLWNRKDQRTKRKLARIRRVLIGARTARWEPKRIRRRVKKRCGQTQSDKAAQATIRRVLPRGEFAKSKKVYNGAGVEAGEKARIKAGF